MASVHEPAVSFTGPTAHNTPQLPRDGVAGRDSLTAVAAMQMPATKAQHHHPLPTPPNSISPNLPPHGLKAAHGKSLATLDHHLDHVDSDLELLDGASEGLVSLSRDAFAALSPGAADGASLDTTGNITPALLAKHHLPEILLNNGPLAIRHVIGFLTTSVPGFSGIPPAKARRLVVGALEGRGSNGEGGLNGDVQFEKVGWGRWNAKLKGHPRAPRPARPGPTSFSPPSSLPSSFTGSAGLLIAGPTHRSRLDKEQTSSWANGSDLAFYRDDHDHHDDDDDDDDNVDSDEESRNMALEDIADQMSLDGNDDDDDDDDASACSSSDAAPDADDLMGDDDGDDNGDDDDPNDITDDEDWAAVGAAALRQPPDRLPGHHHHNHFLLARPIYPGSSLYAGPRGPPPHPAKSAPRFIHAHPTAAMEMGGGGSTAAAAAAGDTRDAYGKFSFEVDNAQEREAVEALLRLGSV